MIEKDKTGKKKATNVLYQAWGLNRKPEMMNKAGI